MTSALVTLATLSAFLYGFKWCDKGPSHVISLTKTIPVSALALIAFLNGEPVYLGLALALSALGDFFLSREGDGTFLSDMAAFFAAHIAYIALFLNVGSLDHILGLRIIYAVIFFIYAVSMMRFLWPSLGQFRATVSLYILVISLMGVSALGLQTRLPTGSALAGVILFVLSDSMLAVEKFRPDVWPALTRHLPRYVWGSYIVAQGLILSAFMQA